MPKRQIVRVVRWDFRVQ